MKNDKKSKKDKKAGGKKERTDSDLSCCYVIDPCGCYVDPCYVDPCGCYVDPCNCC